MEIIGTKLPRGLKNEAKECVLSTLHILNIPSDIELDVEFVETMEDDDDGMENVGSCAVEYQPDGSIEYFTIKLKYPERRTEKILRCLCHELVHLNQYRRGDLKSYPDHIEWRNEVFDIPEVIETYRELPWEVEAHAMADVLYDMYICNKKFIKKPWR